MSYNILSYTERGSDCNCLWTQRHLGELTSLCRTASTGVSTSSFSFSMPFLQGHVYARQVLVGHVTCS